MVNTLRPVVPPSGRGTSRRGPRKRGVPRRMGHGGSIFLLPSWEVKGEWRPFQWPFSEQHCAQTGEYLMRLISRVQKILGRTFATRVQSGLGALAGRRQLPKVPVPRPTFLALWEPPLLERGAHYHNAHTTITTTFFNLSIKTTTIVITTRFFESPNMEVRI